MSNDEKRGLGAFALEGEGEGGGGVWHQSDNKATDRGEVVKW